MSLKILISAYACSPNSGSEPGMAWNFISELSKHNEIHVITELNSFKSQIEIYLKNNSNFSGNIKFFYVPLNFNFFYHLFPPTFYFFYKSWQKKVYFLSIELDKKYNYDIIHQLNMVGYREPGYLWKINKPFVWGPIGGLVNISNKLLYTLDIKSFLYFSFKNIFNSFQRSFSKRVLSAAKRENSIIISATRENQRLISKYWNKKSELLCEVGAIKFDFKFHPKKRLNNEPLKIIWSAHHFPGKNLNLLLNSLKYLSINYELHILGEGKMTKSWKSLSIKLNIYKRCFWHGWLKREDALNVMKSGHIFCITSISELTATVTLESLSLGLPIVCIDHCGFADIVDNSCGIKVPIDNSIVMRKNFASSIEYLHNNESHRLKLANGAILKSKEYLWSDKITFLHSIYSSLLRKSN
jgi:glycosyltransferase involved in cell wall biosynthesis